MNNKKIFPKPIVLIVLSGWGIYQEYDGNAIHKANTPNFDSLTTKYPTTILKISDNKDSKSSFLEMGSGRSVGKGERKIENTLGEILANNSLKQLHIAETENFGYVTYFFNGARRVHFENEDDILIPSKENQDFKMSAMEIARKTTKLLEEKSYDFILLNFSNIDTIFHKGDFEETVQTVEFVDKQLGKVVKNILKKNGLAIITSDHGCAEKMINMQTDIVEKEHTDNPVPFILVGQDFEGKKIGLEEAPGGDLSLLHPQGALVDIAPTILDIMGISKDNNMTGESLLKKKENEV